MENRSSVVRMKAPNVNHFFAKNPLLRALLAAGFLATSFSAFGALAAVSAPQAATSPHSSPVQYSAGIAEVLKMVDAKVDETVIKAYIESSQVAYNPSVSELIMLK